MMHRVLLLASLALTSCAAFAPDGRGAATLVDLEESAAPLASWFDRERGSPRAILIFSPV